MAVAFLDNEVTDKRSMPGKWFLEKNEDSFTLRAVGMGINTDDLCGKMNTPIVIREIPRV
ncbi:MAG: hypothetical protein ACRDQX_08125 [Pseudonocardiaceae bacterium]